MAPLAVKRKLANQIKTSTHQFGKVPKTENNENMIQKLRKQQCIVDCSILSPSSIWLSHTLWVM